MVLSLCPPHVCLCVPQKKAGTLCFAAEFLWQQCPLGCHIHSPSTPLRAKKIGLTCFLLQQDDAHQPCTDSAAVINQAQDMLTFSFLLYSRVIVKNLTQELVPLLCSQQRISFWHPGSPAIPCLQHYCSSRDSPGTLPGSACVLPTLTELHLAAEQSPSPCPCWLNTAAGSQQFPSTRQSLQLSAIPSCCKLSPLYLQWL